jgi:hypothetical protein
MKTPLKLLCLLFLLLSFKSYSQDKIYLKGSKDVLNVTLLEIGLESIKYKPYGQEDSPVLNIEKMKVSKIVTANGDEYTFADPMVDPAMYADQKKNALKLGFFNPFLGSMQFTYERSIKPGKSFETTLGIIGLGFDPSEIQPRGATIKVGYKFIKTPDYILPGMRSSHILNGGYIRPEVIFNFYTYDSYNYDYSFYPYETTRKESFSGALVLNVGKQWVFSNSFLIDFYLGAGYGFASNADNYDNNNHFGFVGAFPEFPIAFTGGLRVGFLFK